MKQTSDCSKEYFDWDGEPPNSNGTLNGIFNLNKCKYCPCVSWYFIHWLYHACIFFSKMKIQISGIPLHLIVIFSKYNYVCHEYLRKKKLNLITAKILRGLSEAEDKCQWYFTEIIWTRKFVLLSMLYIWILFSKVSILIKRLGFSVLADIIAIW